MNDFENKVRNYISRSTSLDPSRGKVVVALSGGADSVALLAVMTALGYRCVAAHCNFHLRGAESDRDMEHARRIAADLRAEFESVHFDVLARRSVTGESVEMACRELRYEWFGQLKERYGAQAVLTGHHRDDNIETMFLNLLRGTGLNGAAGIAPEGERRVSPLLAVSRNEILDYLADKSLGYVTDSTNLQSDFKRNKLRNIVIPEIVDLFPGALDRLGNSLANLSEDRALLAAYIEQERKRFITADGVVDLALICEQGSLAPALAFKLLHPYGFTRSETDSMLRSAMKSGMIYESACFRGTISRGKLQIEPIAGDDRPDPMVITYNILPVAPQSLRSGLPETVFFDSSILDGDPVWTLRGWQTGDRMRPFGMNGSSKKLSDIFNDMKMSPSEKKRVIVLCRDNEIVWIVGIRQSEQYRVPSGWSGEVVMLTVGGDGEQLCRSTQ